MDKLRLSILGESFARKFGLRKGKGFSLHVNDFQPIPNVTQLRPPGHRTPEVKLNLTWLELSADVETANDSKVAVQMI